MKLRFLFSSCFSVPDAVVDESMHLQGSMTNQTIKGFTYNELKSATNGFLQSNKVGEGAFGTVYKGWLQDGSTVAIKMLSVEVGSMRGEREFISEIAALSDIKHNNLVTLRGCCVEGTERFLVYDFMENRSLAQTLLGDDKSRMKFNWDSRKNISIGIARGLAYLHEEVQPYIVHRDIKASNVLLDENFTPKVSDFGLSKLLRENITHISTGVAGTLGYIAPEYAVSGRLTRRSDVYGFGVLLLEIITGSQVVTFDIDFGEQHLVQKTWEAYKEDSLIQMVDPVLGVKCPEEEAIQFLRVGLLCVQEAATLRPRMSIAVKMLTGEVNVDNFKITQPGHIIDPMDIHIGCKSNLNSQSISSKDST